MDQRVLVQLYFDYCMNCVCVNFVLIVGILVEIYRLVLFLKVGYEKVEFYIF